MLLHFGTAARYGCLCLFLLNLPAVVAESPEPKTSPEPKFQILFDGSSLAGWRGVEGFWSVVDGAIQGQTTAENPTKGNTFLVWQGGELGDFEFRCKVRFEGNNSGVQYRSEVVDASNFAMAGYQADLHPNPNYFGMMYGERTPRGIIATRGQRVVIDADGKKNVVGDVGKEEPLVAGDWNDLRIIAVGNRLIHQVNGITTVDITDNDPGAKATGQLGLQLHAGPPMKVEFRSLLLRPLEGQDAKKTLADALDSSASAVSQAAELPQVDDGKWLLAEPKPTWVWAPQSHTNQQVWVRQTVQLEDSIKSARLYATCDNAVKMWINGKSVGSSKEWKEPIEKEITNLLSTGPNVIAAECQNETGVAAFVCKIEIRFANGKSRSIVSNQDWKLSEKLEKGWRQVSFDDATWKSAKGFGDLGKQPWGIPNHEQGSAGGADPLNAKNISVPPGFAIERVYSIPKEQGSWVAMALDPQGRIYACDQGGQGLYRVTMQGSQKPIVEKVSVGTLSDLSSAQGLVWAFDSLWFHRNGGNLVRITDSDGDDVLDHAEVVPGGRSGGEHGNHAVIVTEDGDAIYMAGGNHAERGELAGSKVPTWYEGLLLPRMWDSNGHARGRLAPGGWVTRLDIDAKTQTLHAIGFRNEYDITLNGVGDMFTYDADMEWDMGAPWYRPTRICHVVSGADFGWRSGSGKWPTYYEDSLPPVVEIGPGSPTGMISGEGTRFPTRYQDAVFALDWTFGTIYAIHLRPEGSSYRGEAEAFVYGTPLPVTDAVVGLDGALYFAVGGRGTESALFKVHYIGDESTAAPAPPQRKHIAAREQRRTLEAFHGIADPAAVAAAWPFLASEDRFLRYAARIAIESQDVNTWAARVLEDADPQTTITAAVALARMGEADHAGPLLDRLLQLQIGELSESQQLGALRALALVFTELQKPTPEQRRRVLAKLEPLMPSRFADVNVELVRVLVYLQSAKVAARAMDLITHRGAPEYPDWSTLAARNSRYGRGVQQMLDNPPPAREIQYAFMLRNLRQGWTLPLRRAYFEFLNEAAKTSGGASFPGYLSRTRDEALQFCTDEQRKALEDVTGEDFNPVPDFAIAAIEGPGRAWEIASANQAASGGKPDFERGRSLYFSAKCASCHRLAGLGGNIGPDLTSIPNKFDQNYVIEAIIDPSKVISDQYGSSTVLVADGSLVSGLVVERAGGDLTVYPNQPDAKPIEIEAGDVEEVTASPVSQMPLELLNNLNADEVRDLVAYLMSGGNPEDKRYQK
ncbi:family 16 glycoside hydrolase [Allorhodopirellula heiligendammensis]|uniref:Cytochrome c n=1 Tax=Allorhodopirellula heiligendammensis TaxID=2714739 RepID=A0A5C6BF96_9BACT|nr:family 16 glycoside hydrolase [Allorhodopirellula heiligendammensis]TWU10171.1 Cytochrome c [Allorhodopirellula heiligendammensis]